MLYWEHLEGLGGMYNNYYVEDIFYSLATVLKH